MMRTTIQLREDIYQKLVKAVGKRKLSQYINEILLEALLKPKSLFGTMPKTDVSDIREHKDRS